MDSSRLGTQARDVRSARGLGDGDRRDHVAGDQLRQPLIDDGVLPVFRELSGDEAGEHGGGCDVHITVGQSLRGKPQRHRVRCPGPAVLLGKADAEDAEAGQLPMCLPAELRARCALDVTGRELSDGEPPQLDAEVFLLRTEGEGKHPRLPYEWTDQMYSRWAQDVEPAPD